MQRPGSLTSVEALAEIPPLPTALFKKETLWTMSRRHMAVRATSSGTSGSRSEIGYDWESVWFGFLLALGIGRCHGIFSPVPAHYLMLGYEPCRENRTIIVKTQRISSFFAPPAGRTYALRWKNGAYHLDIAGLLRALSLYSRSALPVRIIGFPSYLYFLLQYLKQEGKRFCLPANSMVLLGGGWKEHERQRVDKQDIYRLLQETMGIPRCNVREFFGAAESPSLYCTCRHGHFHVPIYSHVIIRDVKTLKPLPPGQPGILNLLSPMAKSMPLLSVMTDDLAVLYPGETCGCGIKAPYFELLGRAGLEEIKTCAAESRKILGRAEKYERE